jgi:DNA-binding response OmpR family regulator
MTDRPWSVLVIDDDEDLLELVRFFLAREGYRVTTAQNGQQGLDAVAASMPDLILLDMKMPVMNGWVFAKEYHRRHSKRAPIIVVTAADDARQRAIETGAIAWVSKPFDADDLVRAIDAQLQHLTRESCSPSGR